jgi:type 1 glutamine amidotransferase
VRSDFGTDRASQPQMYLRPLGEGQVLYLTLGHCTGKYDMQPLMEVAPVTRCAWNYPVFYDLLRRGIRWGIGSL